MLWQSSQMVRGLIGAALVSVFAFQAFSYAPPNAADAAAVSAGEPAPLQMPTGRDWVIFERKLRKATNESRFAKSCAKGQISGNTTVHVAMNFPALGHEASEEAPGFAHAHVDPTDTAPKALVLDSKYPTLWAVTGRPAVIVLTGKAVIAHYPEGTPIFAPRYADGCGDASWAKLPKSWSFPGKQNRLDSMVDDPRGRFDGRANLIARKLFNREAAAWQVRRGDTAMDF